jgi:hypothetical protein
MKTACCLYVYTRTARQTRNAPAQQLLHAARTQSAGMVQPLLMQQQQQQNNADAAAAARSRLQQAGSICSAMNRACPDAAHLHKQQVQQILN